MREEREELENLSLLGISDKKKKQFQKKGIKNITDLLYFFPRDYKRYDLRASDGEDRCFRASIQGVRSIVSKSGIPMLIAYGTTKNKKNQHCLVSSDIQRSRYPILHQ